MGHGCPRYCQIRINRELSLTKGKNSVRRGAIWAILKLEDIMILNNVTKFHRAIIKTLHLKEQTSIQPTIFHKLRTITPLSMVPYRPLSNRKKTSWYLTMWQSFIKFWSKLFDLESGYHLKRWFFYIQRAITAERKVGYRLSFNMKKTSRYLTMWPSFIKFW